MRRVLKSIYRNATDTGYVIHFTWKNEIYHKTISDEPGGKRQALKFAIIFRNIAEICCKKPRSENRVRAKGDHRKWKKFRKLREFL